MNKWVILELWKECQNNCDFCYYRGLKDIDKKSSLIDVIDKVQNNLGWDKVGIIGGELFGAALDNPEVETLFFNLLDCCVQKIQSNQLQQFTFTSSLLLRDTSKLRKYLDVICDAGIADKVLLCTSWDIKGRFKNDDEQVWEANMKMLKDYYPDIEVVTQITITQAFVRHVLDNGFDAMEFANKHHTKIGMHPIFAGAHYRDTNHLAEEVPWAPLIRDDFIKFFKYLHGMKQLNMNSVVSAERHANTIFSIEDGAREECPDRFVEGSSHSFVGTSAVKYLDSDRTPWQDAEMLRSIL